MANFQLFLPIVAGIEKGYQNLAGDKGNYNSLGQRVGTNHGISARFYEGVINRPPTVADMKAITATTAANLIKKYFWDDVQGDLIHNQSIANIIADHAVNGGESPIGHIVQHVLNASFGMNLIEDGDIGPKTALALNSVVDQFELFTQIKHGRAVAYANIGGEFLTGWLNRLKSFSFSETEKK